MIEIVERAPAKLNLTLRILGRRPDGYHQLESLVAFADIGETVTLHVRPGGRAPRPMAVRVEGPFATAIQGPNLVATAARLVEQAVGRDLPADLVIDKHMPVASGIGGGSSDAAATLRAIRAAFPELACRIDWAAIARQLGADVPVCLAGKAALISGTGDRVRLLQLPALSVVLANTGAASPVDKTRRVFEALAAPPVGLAREAVAGVLQHLDRAGLIAQMRSIGNDLEASATRVLPQIAEVKAIVAATSGCETAVLSGAGPTIVGVYRTTSAAADAAVRLRHAHPGWWIRHAETGGSDAAP